MSMFGFGTCKAATCNAFSSADPSNDTVKFDLPQLAENDEEDKENCIPELAMKCKLADDTLRRETEKRAEAEAEMQRQLENEEQKQRDENENERQRLQFEEEETERLRVEAFDAAEAEATTRASEQAEMKRQEIERVADVQGRAEEAKEAVRLLQQQEEERAREQKLSTEKVDAFLKLHGYGGVNVKRTKMMRSKYALDTAVKCKDAEMVQLLLAAGANRSLKSSAGKTAEQRARETNKNGSHWAVLAAFASDHARRCSRKWKCSSLSK